jgi:excisionase family DNA binding protein
MSKVWLTLQEAASRVQTHESTLRRAIRAGRLRHTRVGGRKLIRLKPEWIDEWLMEQQEAGLR